MRQPIFVLHRASGFPTQVFRGLAGRSRLPIHEVPKAKVQTSRKRIRPFKESTGDVSFNAWRIAHAVKKADALRWPDAPIQWLPAMGFLLENGHMFDWSGSDWRLNTGMARAYADFTGSSLAGRIAQGMALLFLEDQGYAYVGRFETEWVHRANTQNRSWPKDKDRAPDFIVENTQNEWVLAESKGGFCPRGSKPPIKQALYDGLTQLAGWEKHISPQPIKSLAIATFLREADDTGAETSLIAFVDPEPEVPDEPVEFGRDAVRRANYASWLSLMGFDAAATRLRQGEGEPQENEVPVLTLGGRKFVVSIASITRDSPDMSSPDFWDEFHRFLRWPDIWFRSATKIELVGLDLKVVRALSGATGSAISSELMALQPMEWEGASASVEGEGFQGSVLKDGSLLGMLSLGGPDKRDTEFEWIKVAL